MTVADLNTLVQAAVTLNEAGDVTGALGKLRSARMLLMAMPRVSHGDQQISYNLEDIDMMIRDLSRVESANSGSGIVTQKIEYVRADED